MSHAVTLAVTISNNSVFLNLTINEYFLRNERLYFSFTIL